MIRASGTLGDPNKLGAVAAFWTVGTVVLARRLPTPWSAVVTVVGDGARHRRRLVVADRAPAWLRVARQPARSPLVEAVRALARARSRTHRHQARRGDRRGRGRAGRRRWSSCCRSASTHTVVAARHARLHAVLSAIAGIVDSVNELLWERFGYGPAAIEMIKEHPIDGVGVGMFHALSHDFGKLARLHAFLSPTTRRTGSGTTSRSSASLGSIPLLWWCVVLRDADVLAPPRRRSAVDRDVARRADRLRRSRRCSGCRRNRSRS